jgi:hypothetical protein
MKILLVNPLMKIAKKAIRGKEIPFLAEVFTFISSLKMRVNLFFDGSNLK